MRSYSIIRGEPKKKKKKKLVLSFPVASVKKENWSGDQQPYLTQKTKKKIFYLPSIVSLIYVISLFTTLFPILA